MNYKCDKPEQDCFFVILKQFSCSSKSVTLWRRDICPSIIYNIKKSIFLNCKNTLEENAFNRCINYFFFLVFIFDFVKAVFTILRIIVKFRQDILAAEILTPILDQSLYITIYFPCSRCTRWCSSLLFFFFSFSHFLVCAAVFYCAAFFSWVRVRILANRSDGWDKCPLLLLYSRGRWHGPVINSEISFEFILASGKFGSVVIGLFPLWKKFVELNDHYGCKSLRCRSIVQLLFIFYTS